MPAVVVLRPFVESLPSPDRAWLTVAMASTLAGNLTVLGSIANLIVVQRAAAGGITIGVWRLLPGRRAADPADLAGRDNLAEDLTGDGPLTFFEMLVRSTTASRIGKVASDQKPRW